VVASVCTGATVLAAAGLLDGRRATTHGYDADRLAQRFPLVRVDAAPVDIPRPDRTLHERSGANPRRPDRGRRTLAAARRHRGPLSSIAS
jgi:putative intracellular protease/amidase